MVNSVPTCLYNTEVMLIQYESPRDSVLFVSVGRNIVILVGEKEREVPDGLTLWYQCCHRILHSITNYHPSALISNLEMSFTL